MKKRNKIVVAISDPTMSNFWSSYLKECLCKEDGKYTALELKKPEERPRDCSFATLLKCVHEEIAILLVGEEIIDAYGLPVPGWMMAEKARELGYTGGIFAVIESGQEHCIPEEKKHLFVDIFTNGDDTKAFIEKISEALKVILENIILMVDDEPSALYGALVRLDFPSYRLETVDGVESAKRKIEEIQASGNEISAIILDGTLDKSQLGTRGWQVAEYARNNGYQGKIYSLSGNFVDQDYPGVPEGKRSFYDGFFGKGDGINPVITELKKFL